MLKVTKNKIKKEMSKKKYYNLNLEELNDDVKFERYSMEHYKIVYTILKKKIDTITEKEDKIAYLNSLKINQKALMDTDGFDIIIGILSGGAFGASLSELINKTISGVVFLIFALIIFALIGFKLYIKITRKWDFNNRIFEQLENDIK